MPLQVSPLSTMDTIHSLYILKAGGEISTPNYPSAYPANTNCTWSLISPELDGHVTVTFTHMDFYWDPYSDGACGRYL